MNSADFIAKALSIARDYKTSYIWGRPRLADHRREPHPGGERLRKEYRKGVD